MCVYSESQPMCAESQVIDGRDLPSTIKRLWKEIDNYYDVNKEM